MVMAKGKEMVAAQVLVLPFPVQGHINPMLQFAKRLAARAPCVEVSIATTVFLAANMHANLGPVRLRTITDGYDRGGFFEAGSAEAYHRCLDDVGPRSLAELLRGSRDAGSPYTCLIYDTSLYWALDVAKQFNIMAAAFSTQSSAAFSVYYRVYKGQVSVPVVSEAVEMTGLPPLRALDFPSLLFEGGAYLPILALKLKQFSNLDKADFVLINTVEDLEEEATNYLKQHWRVKTVGPTIPPMYLGKCISGDKDYGLDYYKRSGTNYIKWLDDKPVGSVVYVSFGSIVKMGPEQMEEFAWGLLSTKKFFLWVVRASEVGKLPEEFVEQSREKGLVVPWCGQLEVLAHPALGCFVTHCGWNSILEALARGVPMVGVPQWTDQPTNAKYVEDVWEVGLRARADKVGVIRREEMKACVMQVMEGEDGKKMKKNAGKWKEMIRKTNGEGGSSEKNMEEFVKELLAKSEKSLDDYLSCHFVYQQT